MKACYYKISGKLTKLNDLPLLFFRLVLAYGFFKPAKMKWFGIESMAGWFESLGYPFPVFSAYLAAITESIGVILLVVGFLTRFITVPLMFMMLVAIFTVHWGNGFDAGNNGFEIPLYYFLMLFTLMVYGSGRYSVDRIAFE